MTEKEISAVLQAKYASASPRARRKSKFKMRFGHRLETELARTTEKVRLLEELIAEKNLAGY